MDIYTILSLKEQLDDLDKKRIRLYNNIERMTQSGQSMFIVKKKG